MKRTIPAQSESLADAWALPWDRCAEAIPLTGLTPDRALIPRLEWSRVARLLPETRRLRIDINGCLAGSPLSVPEASVEFAIGWAFMNRFYSSPSELGTITSSAHRVSIMVESGADLDRRTFEAIGWIDSQEGALSSLHAGDLQSARIPRAVPFVDDVDLLSLCERVYRHFDGDGANMGYIHAAIAMSDDISCIARDLATEAAAAKVLGWALQQRLDLGSSLLVIRGNVDALLVDATARAGIPLIVTDAVPTRAAVEVAGATCTSVVGLAMSHRRALFADGGHIGSTT